jgi:hypothetical protein
MTTPPAAGAGAARRARRLYSTLQPPPPTPDEAAPQAGAPPLWRRPPPWRGPRCRPPFGLVCCSGAHLGAPPGARLAPAPPPAHAGLSRAGAARPARPALAQHAPSLPSLSLAPDQSQGRGAPPLSHRTAHHLVRRRAAPLPGRAARFRPRRSAQSAPLPPSPRLAPFSGASRATRRAEPSLPQSHKGGGGKGRPWACVPAPSRPPPFSLAPPPRVDPPLPLLAPFSAFPRRPGAAARRAAPPNEHPPGSPTPARLWPARRTGPRLERAPPASTPLLPQPNPLNPGPPLPSSTVRQPPPYVCLRKRSHPTAAVRVAASKAPRRRPPPRPPQGAPPHPRPLRRVPNFVPTRPAVVSLSAAPNPRQWPLHPPPLRQPRCAARRLGPGRHHALSRARPRPHPWLSPMRPCGPTHYVYSTLGAPDRGACGPRTRAGAAPSPHRCKPSNGTHTTHATSVALQPIRPSGRRVAT